MITPSRRTVDVLQDNRAPLARSLEGLGGKWTPTTGMGAGTHSGVGGGLYTGEGGLSTGPGNAWFSKNDPLVRQAAASCVAQLLACPMYGANAVGHREKTSNLEPTFVWLQPNRRRMRAGTWSLSSTGASRSGCPPMLRCGPHDPPRTPHEPVAPGVRRRRHQGAEPNDCQTSQLSGADQGGIHPARDKARPAPAHRDDRRSGASNSVAELVAVSDDKSARGSEPPRGQG